MGAVARMSAMIVDLLFPRGCAGCDRPDAVLCMNCRRLFHQQVERPLPAVAMGRWFACGWYRGAARHAILSWKDHGDEECDGPFCEMLYDLAHSCGLFDTLHDGMSYDKPVLIVPAPSSRQSVRQRGRRHMMQLAGRLARELQRARLSAKVCNALESRGVKRRSVQMRGVAQRSQRLRGHVVVRPGIDLRGVPVVLVDDIITSGTTMRRCVEALQQAGATVVTVLALAYTPAGRPAREEGHSSSAV